MKEYDVIVIGSGCGLILVDEALAHEKRVALVDRGPLGGTCLNLGCIPSKMLLQAADEVMETQESGKLGIAAQVNSIDFGSIMDRMRQSIGSSASYVRESIEGSDEIDFYEVQGRFIDHYAMDVGGRQIRANTIFIASGSRPNIPPINGLDGIEYLTSDTLLQLTRTPESMVILGGGYIGVEYAHFFAAMGTRVTLIEKEHRLIPYAEPEISGLLKERMKTRMQVHVGTEVEEVRPDGKRGIAILARNKEGGRLDVRADTLLVATGRRSNADLLHVDWTGVKLDNEGFIKVNPRLQTNIKDIYAVGDANGLYMFTHVANQEARLTAHNHFHGAHLDMDYSAAPRAIFSWPQIASVGLTEAQASSQFEIGIGRAKYSDVAKGEAMMEEAGFAKAIIELESARILGFHIIGPHASIIIQEVVNAMTSGGHTDEILGSMHIHPALTELIQRTLNRIEAPVPST